MMGELTKEIAKAIKSAFGISVDSLAIEWDESPKKGDVSTSVSFRLAKKLEMSPGEVSQKIVENLKLRDARVEALNGFINITFTPEFWQQSLAEILKSGKNFGELKIEDITGKKVQIEFISANPTGPLTLGNGRGGFGGDVLARVFERAGAKVEREYYVNDGGNQIKVLGDAIKVDLGLLQTEEEVYRGDYIHEWAAQNKKLATTTKDSFELGQQAASYILEKLIKPSITKLGIKYDNFFHEMTMINEGDVEKTIAKLKEYNMTEEKDGALWFKAKDFGDSENRVLVKSDGEKTYFANDIAYHFDKLYRRKFSKVVDFWGADHQGHVKRMQAAVSALGCPGSVDIVIFQLVRLIKGGQEFKMSKRKGTYVTMDHLLELIGGPQNQAADVARFFFLSRDFNTHMDFDLDLAREHSEKNPVFYVKYAYARIHGILAKADLGPEKPNLDLLIQPQEIELVKELSKLPGVLKNILMGGGYPVHNLTFYVREVATKFHAFYDKCRVIDPENPELTTARLELVKATEGVLRIVMEDLIGIEAPKKM